MDSITQITLGAAVAEATLGRKLGNRALIVGGALGSLPDLDVLVSFGNAVADFTYHRSFSHSFVVLTLIAPLLAWLGWRFMGRASMTRWFWGVFLVLNTHVLLDCFTVYGTQALWPLSDYPIAWATIFIIDPAYTLPLVAGLALTLWSRRVGKYRRANTLGLALSTTYLAWTVVAHHHAHEVARKSLDESSYSYHSLITVPVPFSLLWRSVARGDNDYAEGYYSLLDSAPEPGQPAMKFDIYPSGEALYTKLVSHWSVQRLAWFTKGFYTLQNQSGDIVMSDLRMGVEASYVFNFLVAKETGGVIKPVKSELRRFAPDTARIGAIFRRILDPDISLAPRSKPDNKNISNE
ncbi:MAG: metal-dependent hydrolase [Gammaproteobacteria bacterium]|nr:metal-dependent hydrolase [Gammaproteobacteria bacterium]